MKKALYLALALMGTTAAAIAQQGTPPAGGDKGGQSFEQRKAQMLKRMEERMPSDGQNRRAHGRRRHGARRALSRGRSRRPKLAEARELSRGGPAPRGFSAGNRVTSARGVLRDDLRAGPCGRRAGRACPS